MIELMSSKPLVSGGPLMSLVSGFICDYKFTKAASHLWLIVGNPMHWTTDQYHIGLWYFLAQLNLGIKHDKKRKTYY